MKSSSGHNKIRNMLLKDLNEAISYPFMLIFNQSLLDGKFPDAMKIAEVIPLFKGKEYNLVINYRLISLLMMMSKVLEKIVYERIYKFLEKHNILFDSQYRFQNHCSCEQAILEFTSRLLQAKESGKESAAIFLDLSKAFNMLNHWVLLAKLEQYGISGCSLDWFTTYLHN